jgi:hypothetical protein
VIPTENIIVKGTTQQSGQALVAAALGLVVLLGAAGLAIDMGYLRYQKRLQQSAADSAALAGAAQIKFGGITAGAHEDSLLNGFADGVNNTTVTVHHPPTTGPHAGNGNYVEVLVSVIQPTFFMKIFGVSSATVTARSVAHLGTGRNVIYSLGTGGPGISNTGTLDAAGGIIGNENLSNTGTLNATSIGVVGTSSGGTTPAAITDIVPAANPLSFLTPPGTGGGCQSGVVSDTVPGPTTLNPVPLNPGHYCTGISITGGRNVTLNPGTYAVTGTGISFNGTGAVTGTGVLLYLSAAGGAVSINTLPGSTRILNLTAPTGGGRAGVLFYQNPGNTLPATINGTATSEFQGAFYFPNAALSLNNIGSGAAYTIAVAKSLALSGTTPFPGDYTSLPGGSPIKDAVLVE